MSDTDSLRRLLALPREERQTPEVINSIRELIARDDEALRVYVRWCHFEASLGWALKGDLEGHKEVIRRLKAARRRFQRQVVWSTVATLVMLAIVATSGYAVVLRHSTPSLDIPAVIAWCDTQGTVEWVGQRAMSGSLLRSGERVQSREGQFLVRMCQGATIGCAGMVDIEFRGPQEIFVHSGNVCVNVPPEAVGFCARTPAGRIVDLGTLFGVSVGFDKSTEVHVLKGRVEAYSAAEPREGIRIEAGRACAIPQDKPLGPQRGADPERFARQLQALAGISLKGLQYWREPPAAVTVNTAKTETGIAIFVEQEGFVLPAPLRVFAARSGVYDSAARPELEELPAGTRVKVYFLHSQSDNYRRFEGEITFDRPIVGLLMSAPQLDETDALLGRPGVKYPTDFPPDQRPVSRAFLASPTVGKPSGDEFYILPDGKTLHLSTTINQAESGPDVDQLRILVDDSLPGTDGIESRPGP